MRVMGCGFDLDPPSIDVGPEPLQRGPRLRAADDDAQMRVLACETTCLANALTGPAKRNDPYELVRGGDPALGACTRSSLLLANSTGCPGEGTKRHGRQWPGRHGFKGCHSAMFGGLARQQCGARAVAARGLSTGTRRPHRQSPTPPRAPMRDPRPRPKPG